jgi:hypothetical protein
MSLTRWILTTFKMRTLNIILFIALSLPAFAQEEDAAEITQNTKARERIKLARIAYITEKLGFTPEEAEKFWPVYREYAQKQQELRQQFRDARKNGQDEKTLVDLELKIKQQQLDLEKDYSNRLQKVITPKQIMNLRQAERDFNQMIIRQIQQRQNQIERRQEMRERSQQRLQQRNN